jgi:hypothetical protein
MRLLALEDCDLETGHLALRTFGGTDIPRYAILSHRWTDDEVLFRDVENGTSADRKGYFKLKGAITQARADGFAYLWDDTCCIDKSSSAELSEAINSMWLWYRDAPICHAYLDDVSLTIEDSNFDSHFRSSAWFTRGWTLQELLAPKHVNFYNESWTLIGTRQTLQRSISKTTRIDGDYLNHDRPLSAASVAKKMSWAARRKTTRLEDIAYCLMGLFYVNMPMLYGEGSRAFQRLQEEILKHSDDESIFAWSDKSAKADDSHVILADSPSYFKDSGNIGPLLDWKDERRRPWQTTNFGLNIRRTLVAGQMPLFCCRRGQPGYLSITIGSIGDRSVRCNLAEIGTCMHVSQDDNLYFPLEMPHGDQFVLTSETIIFYTVEMSPAMALGGLWSQDWQETGLHPMNQSCEPYAAGSGTHAVAKQGTYVDLLIQFKHRTNRTCVMVVIGVYLGGSELAFTVRTGDAISLDHRYDAYRPLRSGANRRFRDDALRIGSTVDIGTLHRVSVARAPPMSHGTSGSNSSVVRLLIDIRTLADECQPEERQRGECQPEERRSGKSCCCIL